jgi:hypothetical protein
MGLECADERKRSSLEVAAVATRKLAAVGIFVMAEINGQKS